LDGAVWTATVVREGVAVVAHLAGFDLAVAALESRNAGLAWGRAGEIRFYLADPVATIARNAVAVVAVFGVLIDLAVTAGRTRGHHLAI
jgi:hypothetical protein